MLGPAAGTSDWTCEGVAADVDYEATGGPMESTRLPILVGGIERIENTVFEATRTDEDRPWLVIRVTDGGSCVVATRSRGLLDDLRRQFGDA